MCRAKVSCVSCGQTFNLIAGDQDIFEYGIFVLERVSQLSAMVMHSCIVFRVVKH